jgi:hypothetical protein
MKSEIRAMANAKGNPNWVKGGASPNPRGRPRSGLAMAETIREMMDVDTRRELIRLALDVSRGRSVCIDPEWLRACSEAHKRGEPTPPRPESGETIQPTMGEIQRAWEFLMTWGFQKPAASVELEVSQQGEAGSFDPGRLSPAERDLFDAVLRKAHGLDAPDEDGALEVEPADPRALPAPAGTR